MASVNTRQGLIDYCLRRLGQPVVEINIDEDQLEERVDDALEFFQEYHFDGVEKVFNKHILTQEDITNEYISTDDSVISVVRVLPIPSFDSFSSGFFNEEYQMRLNDLNNFSGSSLIQWSMKLRNFSEIEQLFSIQPTMMYNRKQDRVYLETDWEDKFNVGDIIIVDCYRVLNPSTYPQVYNDMFLKKYTTSLIKRQWGENLKKFTGVVLPGGITLDGKTIYDEAVEEINKIEEDVSLKYELPADGFIG
tara:strand:- start:2487 stop:3233 length:747 start_codon:yes stop_codon:yes gene_type:complete